MTNLKPPSTNQAFKDQAISHIDQAITHLYQVASQQDTQEIRNAYLGLQNAKLYLQGVRH